MTIPNIIKETCDRTICIPIQDELFSHRREIYLTGEITPETADSIIVQLHFLAIEDSGKDITMVINSPGGDVAGGLAIYDTMMSASCPIKTVCVGTAASMAAVLFSSGDQRQILPHARIMLHNPLIPNGISGSALQIDAIAKDIMRSRDTIGGILAQHTDHSLEEVLAKMAASTFFDAEQAVAWGLADYVSNKF